MGWRVFGWWFIFTYFISYNSDLFWNHKWYIGELLYTKVLEVNLFAFGYRLFHEDFSPLDVANSLFYINFKQYIVHFVLSQLVLWCMNYVTVSCLSHVVVYCCCVTGNRGYNSLVAAKVAQAVQPMLSKCTGQSCWSIKKHSINLKQTRCDVLNLNGASELSTKSKAILFTCM